MSPRSSEKLSSSQLVRHINPLISCHNAGHTGLRIAFRVAFQAESLPDANRSQCRSHPTKPETRSAPFTRSSREFASFLWKFLEIFGYRPPSPADARQRAYLIALMQIDDNLTPLARGILCAKLQAGVDEETAQHLIDHLNALVDCWEMKWEPAKPGGPKGPSTSNVIRLKKAA